MHMDEIFADRTVCSLEVEAADDTGRAVMINTCLASFGIALIRIYANSSPRALNVFATGFQLIGIKSLASCANDSHCFSVFAKAFGSNRQFRISE